MRARLRLQLAEETRQRRSAEAMPHQLEHALDRIDFGGELRGPNVASSQRRVVVSPKPSPKSDERDRLEIRWVRVTEEVAPAIDRPAHGAQPAADQGLGRVVGEPDGDLGLAARKVEHAISQRELDEDGRVPGSESRHDRGQKALADHLARRHAQEPARLRVAARYPPLKIEDRVGHGGGDGRHLASRPGWRRSLIASARTAGRRPIFSRAASRRKTVEWFSPSRSAAPVKDRASAIAFTRRNSSQLSSELMTASSISPSGLRECCAPSRPSASFAPENSESGAGVAISIPRRRSPPEPIVDRRAQPLVRDRRDRNRTGARCVQFPKIEAKSRAAASVKSPDGERSIRTIAGWSESTPAKSSAASAGRDLAGVQPKHGAWRVVGAELAGRLRRRPRRSARGERRAKRRLDRALWRSRLVAAGRVGAETGDDRRFEPVTRRPGIENAIDPAVEIGEHMNGRRRADMAGAVGGGRRKRNAGRLDHGPRDARAPEPGAPACRVRRARVRLTRQAGATGTTSVSGPGQKNRARTSA